MMFGMSYARKSVFWEFSRLSKPIYHSRGSRRKILSTPSCRASRILYRKNKKNRKISRKIRKIPENCFSENKKCSEFAQLQLSQKHFKTLDSRANGFSGLFRKHFPKFSGGKSFIADQGIFYKKAHWVVFLTIRA